MSFYDRVRKHTVEICYAGNKCGPKMAALRNDVENEPTRGQIGKPFEEFLQVTKGCV